MVKNKEKPIAPGLVPPQDLEAEQAVLGAILLRAQVFDEVADLLAPDDFYRSAHGAIFRAMVDLWIKKEPIDLVTVTTLLRTRGKLEEVGGPLFLANLSEHVGTSANAPFYAKKLKELSILRRFLSSCQNIAQACFSPIEDVEAFIDKSEAEIFQFLERPTINVRTMEEILIEEVKHTEELFHAKTEDVSGIPSGFIDLDAVTGGWQPGDLILIAARPSMGKTALAMNLVVNGRVPAAFFSLEMSGRQLAQRVISSVAGIDGTRLRTGKLDTEEWIKLHDVAPALEKEIFINDQASLTPMELRAQARRLSLRHKISLVVVDYLQLMSAKAKSREQEVSEISRSLKALSKELHIPVIALSQLNRDVEKRTNKRPILSDLRDSGSLEQDADVIMFIYRESQYKEGKDEGIAEIHVAKQRNGPVRRLKLAFFPEVSRFGNYTKEEEPN